MLGLGWPSLMPKGLRSPGGTGWDSEVWGGPWWKERQVLLSACSAQAAVVRGTKLAFQILLLPFLALSLMIRDTQIVKGFIQVLLGPKRSC